MRLPRLPDPDALEAVEDGTFTDLAPGTPEHDEALDFWADRLNAKGVASERDISVLRFRDPDGYRIELIETS